MQLENKTTDRLRKAGTQAQFAIALALTKTAQKAQGEVKKHIEANFVIRKKQGGFADSVRIKSATKQNLTSHVYSIAGFVSLQQIGGIRTGAKGKLAIPAYSDIQSVGRRTAKKSPSGYLAGDGFLMKLRSGDQVIAHRPRKGDLRISYFLKQKAAIPKKLNLVETVQRVVRDKFTMEFNNALKRALS